MILWTIFHIVPVPQVAVWASGGDYFFSKQTEHLTGKHDFQRRCHEPYL